MFKFLFFMRLFGIWVRQKKSLGLWKKKEKLEIDCPMPANTHGFLKVILLPFFVFLFFLPNCWGLFSGKKRDKLQNLLKYLDGT